MKHPVYCLCFSQGSVVADYNVELSGNTAVDPAQLTTDIQQAVAGGTLGNTNIQIAQQDVSHYGTYINTDDRHSAGSGRGYAREHEHSDRPARCLT